MRKLKLKLGSVKEMLTKEQMKKINGGTTGCDYYNLHYDRLGGWACAFDPCECQETYEAYCASSVPGCEYVYCEGCNAS